MYTDGVSFTYTRIPSICIILIIVEYSAASAERLPWQIGPQIFNCAVLLPSKNFKLR